MKKMSTNPNLILFYQELEMWEDRYREEYCKGKSDEELINEGWWRDNFGEWYCMKLGKEREKKFRKKLYDFLQVSRIYPIFSDLGMDIPSRGHLPQRPR